MDWRFTPTGVGTMQALLRACPSSAVHPHGRGDNYDVPLREIDTFGSPPRAWGQYCGAEELVLRQRFTPTGVGTMLTQQSA